MKETIITIHQGLPTHVTQYQYDCATYYLSELDDIESLFELLKMKTSSDVVELLLESK